MVSDDTLRRDVRMLGDMLGEIIREMAGNETYELVEQVRGLSRRRRAGETGAEAELSEAIGKLNENEARNVARAFTIFFDMANLAEDRHRALVLRNREQQRYPEPRAESIGDAVRRLAAAGVSAKDVQALLDKLCIDLVFTAHPTEAKRRTLRSKIRRLRAAMNQLDDASLLPTERDRLITRMRTELASLWHTDFIRPRRPTVMDEVRRGLSFAPALWEVIPFIFQDMRRALRIHYPDANFNVHPFIRFGSWIGGDRDGNPNVTAPVTAETFMVLRRGAVNQHLAQCQKCHETLSISERNVEVARSVRTAAEVAARKWPELTNRLSAFSENEIYRRMLAVIRYRLEQSRIGATLADLPEGAYRDGKELEADLLLMVNSLREHHGKILSDGDLQDWLDQVRVFGLSMARLDVRQESRWYQQVMSEIFAGIGLAPNYAQVSETEKQSLLTNSMPYTGDIPEANLSAQAKETLALFRLLSDSVDRCGPEVLGGHVISLTHEPSDVLCVLWLWKWARSKRKNPTNIDTATLPIIPLFEMIDDLNRAGSTLDSILAHEFYAAHLKQQGSTQIVMVGYSDSTKDGGYLAANWAQYLAQSELYSAAKLHGVKLVVFHGRGGSLGRGGGPAARAILSLPPESVGGSLRMTEQGEVLAERYDDPNIAHRHLEQVTWGTMLVSSLPVKPPSDAWLKAMHHLSERAYRRYRQLVDQPGFLIYFDQATPISDIEQMPIGSRPSRRHGERTLSDLRAIPWVFAWTQSRHLLPAWYSLGGSFQDYTENNPGGWDLVREMYREWHYFSAMIDNAVMALAKTDMYVAKQYAQLMEDREIADRIFGLIQTEYELSRQAVLKVTGSPELLAETPWLQRSITVRNPYVDPLNLIQVEIFKRLRRSTTPLSDADRDALRDLSRLTIQGIASGMRTTG